MYTNDIPIKSAALDERLVAPVPDASSVVLRGGPEERFVAPVPDASVVVGPERLVAPIADARVSMSAFVVVVVVVVVFWRYPRRSCMVSRRADKGALGVRAAREALRARLRLADGHGGAEGQGDDHIDCVVASSCRCR